MSWQGTLPSLLVAWVATFALHSSLLLAAAWAASRWARLPDRIRETIWKTAVFGPLLTASLQVGLVSSPMGGHVFTVHNTQTDTSPADVPPTPAAEATAPQSTSTTGAVQGSGDRSSLAPTPDPVHETPPPSEAAPEAVLDPRKGPSLLHRFLEGAFVIIWIVWSGHRGLRSLRARLALKQWLADRERVSGGELHEILATLAARARIKPPRLSLAPGLASPMAFGTGRPEICLPAKIAAALSADQRRAVLGHELGHIVRQDPLWFRAVGVMEVLFPWQPLLVHARDSLSRIAEYRSDALAAQWSDPYSVARSLLDVAEFVVRPFDYRRAGVCPAASRGSLLRRRVDRLLRSGTGVRRPESRRALLVGITLVVGVVTFTAPGATQALDSTHADAMPLGAARTTDTTPIPLGVLLEALEGAHASLITEIERLDLATAALPPDPEFDSLLGEVRAQLERLAERRNRIEEHLQTLTTANPATDSSPIGANR